MDNKTHPQRLCYANQGDDAAGEKHKSTSTAYMVNMSQRQTYCQKDQVILDWSQRNDQDVGFQRLPSSIERRYRHQRAPENKREGRRIKLGETRQWHP